MALKDVLLNHINRLESISNLSFNLGIDPRDDGILFSGAQKQAASESALFSVTNFKHVFGFDVGQYPNRCTWDKFNFRSTSCLPELAVVCW